MKIRSDRSIAYVWHAPLIWLVLLSATAHSGLRDFLADSHVAVFTGGTELTPQERALLKRSTDAGWYSVDTGETVRASPYDSNSIDTSDRHEAIFVPTPVRDANANTTTPSSNWRPTLFESVLEFIFHTWKWFVGIALFLLLVSIALFLLRRDERGDGGGSRRKQLQTNTERDRTKITDLPFELAPSMDTLLARSDSHRQAGDYSKAMIYLFSHSLVELDSAGLIHLERGKTNRVYLKELSKFASLRNYLGQMVRCFECVFFGKMRLDEATFNSIREHLPEFEARIKAARKSSQEKPGNGQDL